MHQQEERITTPLQQPQRTWKSRPVFLTTIIHTFRVIKMVIRNNTYAFIHLLQQKQPKPDANRKPAILIFNWRDTRHVWAGGAEVYIDEIAKRWATMGNDVMIFCGNDGHHPQNQIIDNVHITRRGGSYTVYFWAMLYYLFVFRGKYDVIIDCENGIPFFTPLYAMKPIFLLIHHVHQDVFRTQLRFPSNLLAKLLESVCMPLIYMNRPVITVSESSKQEIMKLGFSHQENISVIHNGIKKDIFIPAEKSTTPTFIYLGRLRPYKNVDIALQAFSKVIKKYPHAHFHIVGEGDTKRSLRELANSLQIEKNVTFHGKVSEKTKAALLASSWAMVQPSMVEGWGITVIEANASGTPVIAANVNGLKDSVVNGKTGWLVHPQSSEEFAAIMVEVIKNPTYTQQLATNSIVWSRNFTWDKSATTFYAIIKNALPQTSYVPSFFISQPAQPISE